MKTFKFTPFNLFHGSFLIEPVFFYWKRKDFRKTRVWTHCAKKNGCGVWWCKDSRAEKVIAALKGKSLEEVIGEGVFHWLFFFRVQIAVVDYHAGSFFSLVPDDARNLINCTMCTFLYIMYRIGISIKYNVLGYEYMPSHQGLRKNNVEKIQEEPV